MNGSKNNIIEVLTHREDYISGEVISDEMGISRAAVWKHIKRLKEEGYKIASVRNKGYKLIAYPEQFVSAEIMDAIMDLNLVEQVITLDTIDSTNIEAKRLASVYPSQQMLIISEEQTAGVGRRGRVWQSQKGQGIYMSFLLRPELEPKHASKLTLLAGLAVSGAIRELTGLESYIKWPNDIVVNQKKVAGILTEMSTEMNEIRYLVIGIGINVGQQSFEPEISQVATSLS
nr:biotin--[acetyl-CoA-carboxylase] ligase [Vallitaleaceae bacterium]